MNQNIIDKINSFGQTLCIQPINNEMISLSQLKAKNFLATTASKHYKVPEIEEPKPRKKYQNLAKIQFKFQIEDEDYHSVLKEIVQMQKNKFPLMPLHLHYKPNPSMQGLSIGRITNEQEMQRPMTLEECRNTIKTQKMSRDTHRDTSQPILEEFNKQLSNSKIKEIQPAKVFTDRVHLRLVNWICQHLIQVIFNNISEITIEVNQVSYIWDRPFNLFKIKLSSLKWFSIIISRLVNKRRGQRRNSLIFTRTGRLQRPILPYNSNKQRRRNRRWRKGQFKRGGKNLIENILKNCHEYIHAQQIIFFMQQRESRLSQRAFSSNSPTMSSAYASAMKSMQDKLRNDTCRKSIDMSPQDIMIEQLKQQVNELSSENDRLQLQLMKVSQEMEMNNRASQQIELLQVERLQHLKDYQDRVSELIRKNEELKHDRHEIQLSYESLHRQLQAYKNNEKGLLHKVEMKKFEENSILLNTVQEYKQKIDIKDNVIKKLEKRVEIIESEKLKLEQEFEYYKQKHPAFKLHEFEKQISNLKYQLDEKDRLYLKNIDEAQSNRLCREEQMAKRIQELILKSSEYQDIIQQLTMDYKDLSVKYHTIKLKLDQEEKSHKYLKRRISRQEEAEFNQGYREQRTISKLNLDQISPTLPSPRADQSLRQSQLKQAIRDCLEDMKNSTYSPDTLESAHQTIESRKRLISPLSPLQNNEIEAKLKILNEKYENLIRQAQRENDFKNKAVILRFRNYFANFLQLINSDHQNSLSSILLYQETITGDS